MLFETFSKQITKFIKKNPPSIDIPLKDGGGLLLDRSDLSQRGYKNLKKILQNQNVKLPSYGSVQKFLKSLNIGSLERSFCKCDDDVCFSCGTKVMDTLNLFLENPFWYDKLSFPSVLSQENFFVALRELNHDLYKHLDPKLRTIFLRLTGDNFRASGKFPTEQISFSILNNFEMLHSPYGQFISSLWRGSESRTNVEIHTEQHYQEVKELLVNGVEVTSYDNMEKFNILPIMCADLSFVKEVVGKCSSTSRYGCLYCKRKIDEWGCDEEKLKNVEAQSMKEAVESGKKAIDQLGKYPNHSTKTFTDFQHSHYGQYVSTIKSFV